ncbi:hypothetical protein COV18_02770 [Candidatus Woesearchaeota archaeon CG10_big_fil_rev_8_21_14_0_10_37_12]|nr:MAG: hypothetical protein COV18_02770 [Candidatus Woesearchaeota archaeon CG10_big_fil_rev_8_21_14_0_10_37_12]
MAENYFIISFDFDGVLAHGLNVKRKYAKKWFGVDLELHQTKKEGFNQLMTSTGKSDVNYRSLMDPLNEQHIMEYELPKNCVQVLSRLYTKNCRFVIITSRNNHDYPYAVAFVKEKFAGLIKYIHNTSNEPKGRFVGKLKPRIHIDDDLSKLRELKEYPIELIYYRQPENTGQDISVHEKNRILEANSFQEAEIIIEQIRKTHERVCQQEQIENTWRNVALIFDKTRAIF